MGECTRHRSAIDGQYVTRDYAKANPATTVRETDSDSIGARELLMLQLIDQHQGRIEALEAAVVALTQRINPNN